MGFKLFANNGEIAHGIKNYIADSYKDLNNIPKNAGNIVFVIDESKYYTMNTQLEWVEQQGTNSNSGGFVPTGKKTITENGLNIDVSEYALADVMVPGIVPTGTKQINITQNGTTTENVGEYADAEITVNTGPAKGLVFEDYDSDGYPHSARFVGDYSTIIPNIMYNNNIMKYISTIIIPEGTEALENDAFRGLKLTSITMPHNPINIGQQCFMGTPLQSVEFFDNVTWQEWGSFNGCTSLKSVIFGGDCGTLRFNVFGGCPVELYDFSHCTRIPILFSADSLGHANGCVIKIPAGLSDTTLGTGYGWESETNWRALTNIVWQPV